MPINKPPAKKKKSPAKKAPPKKKTGKAPEKAPAQLNFWQNMSINRRLDLVGTALGILGILTIMSLLSSKRSLLIEAWVVFLTRSFGWGAWVFPISLIVIGVWLVVRNQESIPQLTLERVAGLSLFFLWLLAILHIAAGNPMYVVHFEEAEIGGGYLGALFMRVLQTGLGKFGVGVVLFAWLLICITITLDISIPEFFDRVSPFFVTI